MAKPASTLWLIRHGETEWSASGLHTGRTDIPLTGDGERQAGQLRERLRGRSFALVLTSRLRRARETCQLAGWGATAQTDNDLSEWNYGEYEGKSTAEIRKSHPGWWVWDAQIPGGETVEQVGARADRVIARGLAAAGDVALFAHAHLLRILAARWIGLPPGAGRLLALQPASVSVLGHEREQRVIQLWNDVGHLVAGA